MSTSRDLPETKTTSEPPDHTPPAAVGDTLPTRGQPPQPDQPGNPGDPDRLGRYRILRRLGTGGRGVVYLAFDEALRRRAALKVMLPEFAAVPTARERFLREARACARVRSEHVVTIYDVGEAGGTPFIAMEYLQGCPLDEYLRRNDRLPSVAQVLRVGREAALGLAAAHALGLVHRDVKPGNLWLEAPGGRVKILDFGLAKPLAPDEGEEDEADLTRTGTVVGTPAYMSPEQARGQTVDARTDLFSLGTVLYRLTTGQRPFQGPTAMAVLVSLATDTPPAVRALNPDVPADLADLIMRLLAKDPADRPGSAAEVAADLERIKRRRAAGDPPAGDPGPAATGVAAGPQVNVVPLPVTDHETSAFAGLDAPSATDDGVLALPEPARGRPGGRRVVRAAAVVAVLLAGAVVWRAASPPTPESQPDDAAAADVGGGTKGGTAGGEKSPPKGEPQPGEWRPLFDGKTLAGWKPAEGWTVAHGAIQCAGKGKAALHTTDEFADFELELEYSPTTKGDSGLYVRAAGNKSALVKLTAAKKDTPNAPGVVKVSGARTGDAADAHPPVQPTGWNKVSVRVRGRNLQVTINGVRCQSADFDIPPAGRIGFEHSDNAQVRFRNIRVREYRNPA